MDGWENTLYQNSYGGAILTDLSNAINAINHDILIVKLGAYGFDTASLKLIKIFLTNYLVRTKVSSLYLQLIKIAFRSIPRICIGTTFI